MLQRFNQQRSTRAAATVVALFTSVSLVFGQTKIVAPENKYRVEEDVKAGREAAREVSQQLPMLRDDGVDDYVEQVGQRLVESIPNEFRHSQFRYTFDVVNVSDLNAFALPGGPMYINRGMLQAAKNEGEVAGVLAHEISHVALRHGTAQAGATTKYQVGSILGQIAGAILGGVAGEAISLGSQLGFGGMALKYSRDYERQADLLGAQIMARAGYDARDMANMFQTIQSKGGGSGAPEWLSSHPNPGNRYAAINKEAQSLRVTNPVRNTAEFTQVRSRLQRMAQAPTTEQVMRQGGNRRTGRDTGYPSGQVGRVEPPSGRYETFDGGNLFRIDVPSNWRELAGDSMVTFAPEGGYGNYQGQSVFTHGLQVGMENTNARDLRTATRQFVEGLSQSNPNLRQSGSTNVRFAGRNGLGIVLQNLSDVTRQQEGIVLYTTLLNDGSLFFVVGVAPAREFNSYRQIFDRSVQSLQLNDGYRNSRL